jgi:transposase InsO family protein
VSVHEFIDAEKAEFPVTVMCEVFGVSRSAYYERARRGPSARKLRREELARKVTVVHEASRRTYGSPRVHAALVQQGEVVSEKTIAAVMQEKCLTARSRRAFRVATTDSRFTERVAPNLLDRNFMATRPNQVWVTDVTALPVLGGWVYLASILDLYSRRIVGWDISDANDTALAQSALQSAVLQRRPPSGVLHHSDRGSPYGSKDYVRQLDELGFVRSMSRKGNCWDNAVAESFFSTLEFECVQGRVFADLEHARSVIADYLDAFYNPVRLHSTNGFQSPIVSELFFHSHPQAA